MAYNGVSTKGHRDNKGVFFFAGKSEVLPVQEPMVEMFEAKRITIVKTEKK